MQSNALARRGAPAKRLGVAACAAASVIAGTARAETLADAIVAAYETNPTIQAQRSDQQITDEGYIQARAGWRPTIALQASAGYSQAPQTDPFFGTQQVTANTDSVALTLQQPLYTGGRTLAAVRAARADIMAGREQLRSTEASVLAQVVTAYESVLYDTKIISVRREDLSAFESQVAESQARLKAGDATKTDVAQSQAQLASAEELLAQANAQLQADRALYTTVVGDPPGTLDEIGVLPGLPPTVDEAFDLAENNNPDLARAVEAEQASSARIAEARAARRPSVALQASAGYGGPIVPFEPSGYFSSTTVQVVVTQPIYDGGQINSGVRVALAQNTIDRVSIEATRREVVQTVAQSWNAWLTASANIDTTRAGLAAAQVAFKGSQIEYRSGLRSTTDVLLAEQALSNANVAVAQAQRDEILAEAALLAVTGRLEAKALVTGLRAYDPSTSFNRRERAAELPGERLLELGDHVGAPTSANRSGPPSPPPPTSAPTLRPATQTPPSGPLITTWPGSTTER